MRLGVNNGKGLLFFGAVLCLFLSSFAAGQTQRISAIRFIGDFTVPEDDAREIVKLNRGDPFTSDDAQAAAQRLRENAIGNYRPLAKVSWRADPGHGDNYYNLIFTCDPGPEGRLKQVLLRGNRALNNQLLLEALNVVPKTGFWDKLLRRDTFQPEDLELDQAALQSEYMRRGYLAVDIGAAVLEKPAGIDGFRLTWPILREGPVYTVGYVGLDSDLTISPEALKNIMTVEAGEIANMDRIGMTRARLQDYLYRRGYAFADVQLESDIIHDRKQVDLLYVINAGKVQRIRGTLISGNKITNPHIIEREIKIGRGDQFDPTELELAQARLQMLPFFEEVKIDYDGGPEQEDIDLHVRVQERKSGRVEAGMMYGDAQGAAFQFNVTEMNLSLRPPYRGDALQGNLGLTLGSKIIKGDIGLRNPRLSDSDWSLGGGLIYEDSEYVSQYYDQRSISGQILTDHPIGDYQSIHTGYAASALNVYNIDPDFAEGQFLGDRDLFLTSWLISWDMTTTDRVFRPSSGYRLHTGAHLGSRFFGGDTDVLQTRAAASLFLKSIGDDVITLRGSVRSIQEYGDTENVPTPLRLFLGGANDMKGFEYRSVSPLDVEGRPIGGQTSYWATIEYIHSISSYFDLAFYYDIGDVSMDAYSFSGEGPISDWGIGLMIRAANFPVRFDYAFPIETYENDIENEKGKGRLSFSVGYRY
jgi:outer membrane protein insertion porin family